jgi:1,4-dihydroxy-2-naphthoate polyprenyltransferase
MPAPLQPTSLVAAAWAVVKLGRPHFLVGGVALHSLGIALANANGSFDSMAVAVWGQLAVSSIQLMTHYSNDYFDVGTDLANATPTRWSGGSRVLPSGVLPPVAALIAALVAAAFAVVAMVGMATVLEHRAALVMLAIMLAWSWSYSSPPLRLHSRGLGELTVVAVVAIGTPMVGYVAQSGRVDVAALAMCTPLALLQLVMVLTIELPDEASDRQHHEGGAMLEYRGHADHRHDGERSRDQRGDQCRDRRRSPRVMPRSCRSSPRACPPVSRWRWR